jgi:hypothetical protein
MKPVRVERYTPERKAEFLLSNAVDDADYRKARKTIRKLGIDPGSIPHASKGADPGSGRQ